MENTVRLRCPFNKYSWFTVPEVVASLYLSKLYVWCEKCQEYHVIGDLLTKGQAEAKDKKLEQGCDAV